MRRYGGPRRSLAMTAASGKRRVVSGSHVVASAPLVKTGERPRSLDVVVGHPGSSLTV